MPSKIYSNSALIKGKNSRRKKDSPAFRGQVKKQIRLVLVILLLHVSLINGCYHYRVVAPDPEPATDYESRVAHSLFWGLLQSKDISADDCLSNALDEVRMTTNLGYSVISVATLGIWMPMNVQWKCAKEPLQEGEL